MKYAQELADTLEAEALKRERSQTTRSTGPTKQLDRRHLNSNEGREILNRIYDSFCVWSGLSEPELKLQAEGISLEVMRAKRESRMPRRAA